MDDEAAVRDLTSQLLGALGYEVTAVPDGLKPVRLYGRALRRREQFQAVICDVTCVAGWVSWRQSNACPQWIQT